MRRLLTIVFSLFLPIAAFGAIPTLTTSNYWTSTQVFVGGASFGGSAAGLSVSNDAAANGDYVTSGTNGVVMTTSNIVVGFGGASFIGLGTGLTNALGQSMANAVMGVIQTGGTTNNNVVTLVDPFTMSTNSITAGALAANKAYMTNLTSNITLGSFTGIPSGGAWSTYLIVTNSSASTVYSVTFPSPCIGSGEGNPPTYYVTNSQWAEFQINGYGPATMSVSWKPHW